jgi:hypothetical protein
MTFAGEDPNDAFPCDLDDQSAAELSKADITTDSASNCVIHSAVCRTTRLRSRPSRNNRSLEQQQAFDSFVSAITGAAIPVAAVVAPRQFSPVFVLMIRSIPFRAPPVVS